MTNVLKAGDIVRLKSGGPKMTVIDYEEAWSSWQCTWFDSKNTRQTDHFATPLLERVEDTQNIPRLA